MNMSCESLQRSLGAHTLAAAVGLAAMALCQNDWSTSIWDRPLRKKMNMNWMPESEVMVM